ncbi:Uma2 family endonuclease [Argonema galeatum]|uniref:Uma2 family endonuclease n=1 Tax=Argonema galeatum TaxID=2942762 RepID=UPI002012DF33|nr:Uma2 family endonuclease [Argonema galeatum]MCL1463889.1 Uma2 family endonuclease [Argonema galeatum A003/A1]
MIPQLATPTETEIVYPENDGNPMSDNTEQFKWIVLIKENLEIVFANDPNIFVAGDLLWYPVEGDNKTRQAPDAMVAFGRPKGKRGSYQQWKEDNIPPQVVFEILSPGNTLKEMAKKLQFYNRFGVEEYYIYNPDTIDLTGWLRSDAGLEVIDVMEGWVSPRLEIRFEIADELQIFSPSGERFMTSVELAQLKEQERQRAETERLRAETERQRAEQAEARLQILEARLRELGIDPDA